MNGSFVRLVLFLVRGRVTPSGAQVTVPGFPRLPQMQKYNTSDQHAHESNANGHNDGWIELGFFDRGAIFTRVGTKTVTISLDTADTMATALVWAGADRIVESFVAPSSFGWASWMR